MKFIFYILFLCTFSIAWSAETDNKESSEISSRLASPDIRVAYTAINDLRKSKKYDVIATHFELIQKEYQIDAVAALLEGPHDNPATFDIMLNFLQEHSEDAPNAIGEPQIAKIVMNTRVGGYLAKASGVSDKGTDFMSKKSIDAFIAKLRLSSTP